MPATSRLLYYDLGMNADDDGFAEWFTIVRMTGAAEQDLKILQANGLVHIFDENVLVVRDWKENNYIPKDRYTPSKYLSIYRAELDGIQPVYKLDTQVRLGKDSKSALEDEKRTYSQELPEGKPAKEIDAFQAHYSELCDWAEARRGFKFVARVKQYTALKKARIKEINPDRMQKRWKEFEIDDFWIEKGFDWTNVINSFDKRA